MDSIVSVSNRLDVKAQAWRISFSETPPEDETVFATITEPQRLVVTARSIEVVDALEGQVVEEPAPKPARWWWRGNGTRPKREEKPLLLIWVPSDAGNSRDIEQQLKLLWPAEGEGSRQPLVRAGIRTSRVFWSNDRAIIFASAEQSRDAIDAVLRFTVVARQTERLEKPIAELWSSVDAHKSLVHAVTERDQRMQKVVNDKTEQATLLMSMLLRVTKTLEQLDPLLQSPSKRLYAELVLQAGIYDRLEAVEEPIEFAMDHYELANTRLIEARTSSAEIRLAVLICLLLASELVVAFLAMATSGSGLLSTGISVAQQSPEIGETIGDAYQIGRLKVNGDMVVPTILYKGRPIATGVMLPARAEVGSATGASTPGAAGALEIGGTLLSGEVSGKYFILHRARGNRSTIHEIFFDGESIGQVAEDAALDLPGGPPSPANVSRDSTNPPAVAPGSAFSFESSGDVLIVHIVQPDGTMISATSRNGGRLEQVIEPKAVAATTPVAKNAVPAVSDPVIPGDTGPINSGTNDIANVNTPPDGAARGPENLPAGPAPGEVKQSVAHNDDPPAISSVGEPLKSKLPKIRIPLQRRAVRTAVHAPDAIPERLRRPITSLNSFATAAPAPSRSPRPRVSRPIADRQFRRIADSNPVIEDYRFMHLTYQVPAP